MAKERNNLSGRRSSSHNTKPYDANNSFVKKVATKVTDFIPQKSWISKWFNTSQTEGDDLDEVENPEEVECEEDTQKPPPLKRLCIRMDVTHPPGTFTIHPRDKTSLNKASPSKQQYSIHEGLSEDFSEPVVAGPSEIGHLISSTPATETNIRSLDRQRSELNSLIAASNNETTNGMDDNSESSESTSGCSSLIPQTNRQEAPSNVLYDSQFSSRKRFRDDKLTFTNHLQSPRSLFLDSGSRDSLSSRRPSFNASVMTNTLDRASPLSSPFYNGNITFGGANAAAIYKRGRSLFNNSNEVQLKGPRRTNVEVKPSTAVDSSGMSQTARKILEALEHFSSPISDAKKIPLKATNNMSQSLKRAREEPSPVSKVGLRHLTRELTVPTVPDILKIRRRQKLQDTTVAARKIVSARSDPPPPPQEYHLRTQADENPKHHGMLKAKTKGNLDEEETVEAVNLPNIPLPISSLPNFSFAPANNPSAPDKSIKKKEETFTFASPIKVTNVGKNLKSINNFTFSSPISANGKQSAGNSRSPAKRPTAESNSSTLAQNFIWSGSSTAPRPKTKPGAASSELKSGSVMDVLCPNSGKTESAQKQTPDDQRGEKAKKIAQDENMNDSPSGKCAQDTSAIWECSECLIKNNNSEAQCFACKASKPTGKSKLLESSAAASVAEPKTIANDCFGSQFKLLTNQWECASCYVRNKQVDVKCVACSSPKPSAKLETETKPATSDPPVASEGSWECPGCMLRNAVNSAACSCCNTSKPNSLKVSPKRNKNEASASANQATAALSNSTEILDKFKPSKETWECPSCMVRNANTADSCPCCNTAKPGAASAKAPPLPTNGFGDKFKKPEGAWTCDSCMLQNEAKVGECVACGGLKPGAKKPEGSTASANSAPFSFGIPANAGGFKFGIDKANQKADAPVNGFKFGESQQTVPVGQFTFGIQKDEAKTAKDTGKPGNSPLPSKTVGFGFQVAASGEKTQAKQDVAKEAAPSFLFGMPKPSDAPSAKESLTSSPALSSGFTFGAPKAAEVSEPKPAPALEKSETVSKPAESAGPQVPTTTPAAPTTAQEFKPSGAFSFGVPATTAVSVLTNAATTSLPTSFQFAESKPAQTAVPAFGQIPTTTPATGLTSTFTFGENKAAEPATLGKTTTATNSNLGSSMFSSIAPASSLFGGSDAKTPATFGADEGKTPAFGAAGSKPSAFAIPENKVPAFGNLENKPSMFATDAKLPVFGNTEKTAPVFNPTPQAPAGTSASPAFSAPATSASPAFGAPATTPSLFGSSATPVFENNSSGTFGTGSTPSIFSTAKPGETATSNANLFTFGAAGQPAAPAGSGFNFTANANPATTTPKPLFTFGGNANPPAQAGNNLFEVPFNNPAQGNPPSFAFNAPKPETPAFGQTATAAPIFGALQQNAQNTPTASFSATPSTNAGFNFGFKAAAAPSEGYNFGGAPPAAPASVGFNFNPPSTTPTFDPNTRPSFNFTGGSAPPAFNATPQPSMPRKIKKAVRRMR